MARYSHIPRLQPYGHFYQHSYGQLEHISYVTYGGKTGYTGCESVVLFALSCSFSSDVVNHLSATSILRRPGHVLHPLLPPLKTTGYHLRKRSHGLKLSAVQSSLLRKNFIYRMLYMDIYWICLFYHTVYFWICYVLFYYYLFCILTSIF